MDITYGIRVYSMDDGVEEIPLGLYLVKGDQMYVMLCNNDLRILCGLMSVTSLS